MIAELMNLLNKEGKKKIEELLKKK